MNTNVKGKLAKVLTVLLVSVILTIVAPLAAMAATTADVTVTATPTYIALTNTPDTYDFGTVAASATPATTGDYFTANNTGSVTSNITFLVTAANWSGGIGWIHSDTATPGLNTVGLKGGSEDVGVTGVIIKTTAMDLYTNLAAGNHTHWGMTLYAPTDFGDGVQKTAIVRLTIIQA